MNKAIISFILVLFLTGCRSKDQFIEKTIEEFMHEGKVPGLFLAVIKDDSILYQKGFGVTDIVTNEPVRSNTEWEPGSITKAFTAEMIAVLYHQKKLEFTDSITKFLKNAPSSWNRISISDLLTHCSGIQNYLLDPRFHAETYFTADKDNTDFISWINSISSDSMVRMFYTLPLEFEPGATWSYSNTGYIILGKIVESVSGLNFFDFAKKNLMNPLGMTDARPGIAIRTLKMAQGYMDTPDGIRNAMPLAENYAGSAGAWVVSGNDMISYLKAYHMKRLPSDLAGIKWINGVHEDHPFLYNGGRFFSRHHDRNYTFHNGGTPGFSSSWIYQQDENISVLVLINKQDYAPIDNLAQKILLNYTVQKKLQNSSIKSQEAIYWETALRDILGAIKQNNPIPNNCSKPLLTFLESENGRGLWKWFFSGRFPDSVKWVGMESSEGIRQYFFRLHSSNHDDYTLIATVNQQNKLLRLSWW